MKLGYRDRLILIGAIIIIIIGVGFFVFIKPKYEKLKKNQEKLEKATTEWQDKLNDFKLIPTRQGAIKRAYEEGLDVSKRFTDEMGAVDIDKLMQEFLNTDEYTEHKVSAKKTAAFTDEVAGQIGYYYYRPNIVTYPLYEYADLDDSLKKATAEKLKDVNILAAKKAQTISNGQSSFTVSIKREDLMSFLDAVYKYANDHDDAMMITSVKLVDPEFNEDLDDGNANQEEVLDDEGNPIPQQNNNEKKNTKVKKDYTEATISYRALYIQEPKEPDVGPAYDEKIWDGNEWRTMVAE